MSWEDTFEFWAKPPGQVEMAKCDNAVNAIKKAKNDSAALSKRKVRVFAQGSYCNRTNVRQDSDVDICILCSDSVFVQLPDGKSNSDFGLSSPADYSYSQFKNDVEQALKNHFTAKGVTRGNKAFDIHENTYRVDADAVPCFEYRFYFEDGSYRTGTSFQPESGQRIFNYPEQNYANGVTKNAETGQRFKDVVRILKRLRNKMADENISAAKPTPSFLLECLVWNVPNGYFGHDTYTADVRDALAHLFNNIMKADDCKEWCEINGFKYLFHSSQPWTMQQAHDFTSAAWDYVGFK
jgi:hypothetical protein